jgi:CBS domain-containing protein
VAPLATAAADDTVQQAALTMRDRGVGCLIVVRDGHPLAVITDRDLVIRVLAEGIDPKLTRIGDVATYDPITCSVHEDIETASERMRTHGIRRLPIVGDQGEVIGIVTADDLLMLLGRELAGVSEGIENRSDATDSR